MKKIHGRKLNRRIMALGICVTFAMGAVSCGKSQKEAPTTASAISTNAGTVQLYHINGIRVEEDKERYQLKQPDSLPASVDEVMGRLTLPEGIEFKRYKIDSMMNISIFLSASDSVPEETLLLTKAVIVRSLKGLTSSGDIGITVTRYDENQKEIGDVDVATYTDSSFFYYDDAEDSKLNTGDVVLYLPNGEGRLKKVRANLTIGSDDSAAESVLNQLIAYDVLPKGTVVNNLSVMNQTANLDLSAEFLESVEGISPELVVYSIVDSLVSLPNITKVQITVEGEKVEWYQKQVNIGGPLEFRQK